jgi:hypothetical protein
MSCYWWANIAFFIAGFWSVFAVANYFWYRRQIRSYEKKLQLVRDEYHKLYRGPRRWNTK